MDILYVIILLIAIQLLYWRCFGGLVIIIMYTCECIIIVNICQCIAIYNNYYGESCKTTGK